MQTVPIPIESIEVDSKQVRQSYSQTELIALAENIRHHGLFHPLRVKPADASGKHRVISGNRRCLAMQQLGSKEIPCIIVANDTGEAGDVEEQLVENLLRENLNPLDEAQGYQRLMELKGLSVTQVADRLQIPASRISRTLPLLTLPEDIRTAIRAGTIHRETAYYLSRLPEGEDRDRLLNLALKGALTRDEAARAVAKQTAPREVSDASPVSRVSLKLTGGRTFTISGSAMKLDVVIDSLEEILREARKARTQGLELSTLCKVFKDRAAAAGGAA